MPTRKRLPRRRRAAKKRYPRSRRSTLRMGDHKALVNDDGNLLMHTNSVSRTAPFNLTQITKGDLFSQRGTNLTYFKNVLLNISYRNPLTTLRFLRITVVTLRGSTAAADTVTWTDLFQSAAYVPAGNTGLDDSTIVRVNSNEYKKVYDRSFKLMPTGAGTSNAGRIRISIPIRKIVSYPYENNAPRKNATWMIWNLCEAAGVAVSASNTSFSYTVSTHFYDCHRSTALPR